MTDEHAHPPLKSLHSSTSLVQLKLAQLETLTTEAICRSLLPEQEHCLKARPDGTILDGHHRIYVLRMRGVDVDRLPREIIIKED